MKMMAVKKVREYTEPFINDVSEIVGWAKSITIIAETTYGIFGGVLLAPNVLAVSGLVEDKTLNVILPNNKKMKATYSRCPQDDLYLSFYLLEKSINFDGIPSRKDPIKGDTFLFSYIKTKNTVNLLAPIKASKSLAYEQCEELNQLRVNVGDREHLFPVLDRFGYFVGLSIGTSAKEQMVQLFHTRKTNM